VTTAGSKDAEEKVGNETSGSPAAGRGSTAEVRTVISRELLGARGLLRIEHEGETYLLRITRNNRLILTK
jgi:hemin uptake protein HemP